MMDEQTDFDRYHTPPISIFHLMLWTLFSAIFLAVFRVRHDLADVPQWYALLASFSTVVGAINAGGLISCALALFAMRIPSGSAAMRHPGHWLIASYAIFVLGILLAELCYAASGASRHQFDRWESPIYSFFVLGSYLASSFVAFVASRRFKIKMLRWRFVFVTLTAIIALQGSVYLSIPFGSSYSFGSSNSFWIFQIATTGHLLAFCTIVGISIAERNVARDWLHWAGICFYLSNFVVRVVWSISVQFS